MNFFIFIGYGNSVYITYKFDFLLNESDFIGPELTTFYVTNNGHSWLGNKDCTKKNSRKS